MGTTFNNTHVRTNDVALVRRVLTDRKIPSLVLEPARGWTTIVPLDFGSSLVVARALAEETRLPVLSLGCYDDDIAYYTLFENGALVDEFNSNPDYFGDEHYDDNGEPVEFTDEDRARLRGRPGALLPYAVGGTTMESIVSALQPSASKNSLSGAFSGDAITEALVGFLGLGWENAAAISLSFFDGSNTHPVALVAREAIAPDQVSRLLDETIRRWCRNPSPAETAAQLGWLDLWLSLGADPSADANGSGFTLLHRAVAYDAIEAIPKLLAAGADPTRRDTQGKTPLDYARSDEARHLLGVV